MNQLVSKVNILGSLISTINMPMAIATFGNWIKDNEQTYVCVTPAHSIMDAYHNPDFRSILNKSGLTTPDGMAVVWLLKWKGHKHVSRVYGPDLMLSVCAESVKHRWKHFFYGGAPGVAETLAMKLCAKHPGLTVCGTYCPPFRSLTEAEDQEIVRLLNDANPDIIWVGISSPKQEFWMAEHRDKLKVSILVGVGAAFDFLSGAKPQAPRWIQRAGLEWLYRLAHEPKRLFPRYAQYPKFVILSLAQLLGLIDFPDSNE